MGSFMAANLIKGGHDVIVFNRTREKMQPLKELGAKAAVSIAGVCKGDVIITMLSDDRAVKNIVFGDEGLIKNMNKGTIHISMSTISTDLSERLNEDHSLAGQMFISAPVFGRPDSAAAAKLFIIAAGKHSAYECVLPLFYLMGQKSFYIGKRPQDANLFKLSGNFLIASVIESLGEVMALIGKAGMDRDQFLEILTSTLFTAPVYKTYGKQIIGGKFKPAGFAAPLGQKDIGLIITAAENLKVPMPLASLLHDRFLTLLAGEGESMDWSAIGQLAAKDSGM